MIEFQYFEGCPNAVKTLENLKLAMKNLNIAESYLEIREVSTPEVAELIHFHGSPTILIDGVDIYTGNKPMSSNFTCRIYNFSGRKTGIIPQDFIESKLHYLIHI
ncbi:alkylmercury lyase [Gracilinema caldarium]|uniref:alkylmercury lyase n=1 Tax=Gracilinema caldarium TaxID=215591 RepID=UPI0026EDE992|nr:alkylmercury lyase [Gracilinema caldarium]